MVREGVCNATRGLSRNKRKVTCNSLFLEGLRVALHTPSRTIAWGFYLGFYTTFCYSDDNLCVVCFRHNVMFVNNHTQQNGRNTILVISRLPLEMEIAMFRTNVMFLLKAWTSFCKDYLDIFLKFFHVANSCCNGCTAILYTAPFRTSRRMQLSQIFRIYVRGVPPVTIINGPCDLRNFRMQ